MLKINYMDKELKNKLEKYAKKRADEVYDIDIYELRHKREAYFLGIIDGAKWILDQQKVEYGGDFDNFFHGDSNGLGLFGDEML